MVLMDQMDQTVQQIHLLDLQVRTEVMDLQVNLELQDHLEVVVVVVNLDLQDHLDHLEVEVNKEILGV